MSNPIKVAIGTNIKRESVFINPAISAGEPVVNAENLGAITENQNKNVIASGASSGEVLRKLYGRRK